MYLLTARRTFGSKCAYSKSYCVFDGRGSEKANTESHTPFLMVVGHNSAFDSYEMVENFLKHDIIRLLIKI